MKNAMIKLETLTCPSCVLKIEAALKSLKGVNKQSVEVLFNSSKVKLEFDENTVDLNAIEQAITALGYQVKQSKAL